MTKFILTALLVCSGAFSQTSPYISARDFGAKGNGTTNDYDAIRNALAAVGSGGTLLIPPGIYLSDPTQMAWNITGRTVLAHGATFKNGYFYTEGNSRFHGGKIVQQSPGSYSQAVRINGSNVLFQNLDFQLDGAFAAFLISQGMSIRISGSEINKSLAGATVYITGGKNIVLDNITTFGAPTGSDDTISIESSVAELNGLSITNLVAHNSSFLVRLNPSMNYPTRNVTLSNASGHNVVGVLRLNPHNGQTVESVSVSNVSLTDYNGGWMYQGIFLEPQDTSVIRNVAVSNLTFVGRVYCPNAAQHQPVRLAQNSPSTIEGIRISNLLWRDLYDGAASGQGCPAPNFFAYDSTGGGKASDISLAGIIAKGTSGPGIVANAPITRFSVTDSQFSNILSGVSSGNLVSVTGGVRFSGVTFSDLSAAKTIVGATAQ